MVTRVTATLQGLSSQAGKIIKTKPDPLQPLLTQLTMRVVTIETYKLSPSTKDACKLQNHQTYKGSLIFDIGIKKYYIRFKIISALKQHFGKSIFCEKSSLGYIKIVL